MHPLGDKQSFMKASPPPIPFDQPSLVALNFLSAEAWIRNSSGTPDEWREAAGRWQAPGATHLTFYTSGQGVGPVEQRIKALRQFSNAMR